MKREAGGRVRLDLAALEAGLSPVAARASTSRGRERAEQECLLRTPFQRDRDRIVHSKAFRRLKHKTQVLIAPEGDHYRTRLTHTLEVSGIARAASRALRLNEDLAEAISLGHDLGHTPFGHAGEDAVDGVLRHLGYPGFRHNEQSLRVVDFVENEGRGLNLTWEVRDGILCHTGQRLPSTLEGAVVRICDRIAYINHDIDDALRAGVVSEADLPREPIALLGRTGSDRIDMLVHDLVDASDEAGRIVQSEMVGRAMEELRDFLFAFVYVRSSAGDGPAEIREIVERLFRHLLNHPEALPSWLLDTQGGDGRYQLVRAVTDYVAGMTDRYAQRFFSQLVGGADHCDSAATTPSE